MKFIRIGFVAVLLLLLVVPVGWAKGEKPAKESQTACATVTFEKADFDDTSSTTTWHFWVDEDGACKGKDLSNWALVLPDEAVVVSAEGPKGSSYEVGPNPHTPDFGDSIKWDVTDSFTSGNFSVTLYEEVYPDSSTLYATKAGPTVIREPLLESQG
jgi:hypothetical protein